MATFSCNMCAIDGHRSTSSWPSLCKIVPHLSIFAWTIPPNEKDVYVSLLYDEFNSYRNQTLWTFPPKEKMAMGIYTWQHTVIVIWSCSLSETLPATTPNINSVFTYNNIWNLTAGVWWVGHRNKQNLKPCFFFFIIVKFSPACAVAAVWSHA